MNPLLFVYSQCLWDGDLTRGLACWRLHFPEVLAAVFRHSSSTFSAKAGSVFSYSNAVVNIVLSESNGRVIMSSLRSGCCKLTTPVGGLIACIQRILRGLQSS